MVLPMRLSQLSYYADFFLSAACVVGLIVLVAMHAEGIQLAGWLCYVVLGGVGWTLLEYATHRWIYHRVPFFKELHNAHHAEPDAHIGAPPVIGLVIIFGLFFVPIVGTSLLAACGVTTGMLLGYMAYMLVHHAAHYWTLPAGTWLYQARHHHAVHHYRAVEGNYGITTTVWDHAFGTAYGRIKAARDR
jgi:sterol desaturase/sphingolipid hydroxylase (fatty acid hydroxylase superfamily)